MSSPDGPFDGVAISNSYLHGNMVSTVPLRREKESGIKNVAPPGAHLVRKRLRGTEDPARPGFVVQSSLDSGVGA